MSEGSGGAATAGSLLRAARESRGLHIAALAAAIKVAPRKLDALENDRWNELPDATFTRALAQTVCRTLKIDAGPVLDLLPALEPASLEDVAGSLNTPFQDRPGVGDSSSIVGAIRPMVWAGLVLLAAAAVFYLLPAGLWAPTAAAPSASSPTTVTEVFPPATAPSASLPQQAGSPEPAAANASAAAAPLVLAASAVNSVQVAPAASAASPLRAASAAPASIALPPPLPLPVAGDGPVQLRADASSWIEARDARGRVLLSRELKSGEAVVLDGAMPIRVTIGNASATRLTLRGQPVDLAPRTRDNVARLELQ